MHAHVAGAVPGPWWPDQAVSGSLGVVSEEWRGVRYDEWERRTAGPLLVLSLCLLPILVVPMIVHNLDPDLEQLLGVTDYLIWAAFAVDYLVRLRLARQRATFVRRNLPDLVLVVVPFLRPLRAARLLRFARLGTVLRVVVRRGERTLAARALAYVGAVAAASVLLATVAENEVERDAPNATIHGIGDSLWWAFSTVSTVGYGDRYPVTPAGRVVAAALMVVGVSLFGVITASLATFFVRHVRQQPQDVTGAELAQRLARVELLLEQLVEREARRESLSGGAP